MGNSARIARERLGRLAYREWLERVDELLGAARLSVGEFPESPFESWHKAGLKAGRVAQVIIACQHEARTKGLKRESV